MDLDRKRRLFQLLRQLMDAPVADRVALAQALSEGDAALAQELLALSGGDDLPWMDAGAAALAGRLADRDDDDLIGQEIDGWLVLAQLGEGGMGTVYRVQRQGDGYLQEGALKRVKRGMDSQALLARFRRERHILSRLEHPHIAGLIDGGVSRDGRPYLVMAYIEGEPLLDWAQRHVADLATRLRLFLQLCNAVAHAHRQLIVHRDIKPANILVDAQGDARLLDFGIAKVLESTDDGEHTVAAGRFMSRAYAAPEQSQDGAVTTATDIYQLGVVLFELLSGSRHADTPDATGGRTAQRLALARERAGADGPAGVSAQQLRGDLGIIVARATDPEPARRYETVAALADDVQRFIADRPIQARPNSALYRLRRFVTRHRWSVAASAAALLALVIITGVALLQAQRADREARLARAAQDFLVRVFDASAPDAATGARISARQLLDQGVALIGTELADEPSLRGEMQVTMGRLYRQLGQYDAAAELLQQAHAGRGGEIRQRALAALELATVQRHREQLVEAEQALQQAFAMDVQDPELQSALLLERSHLREIQGELDAALADARAAAALAVERGVEGQITLIHARHAEALALTRAGRHADALAVYETAGAEARRVLGNADTRLGMLYNDQAGTLLQAARPQEAEAAARAALDIFRQRLDTQHPALGQALQILGGALRQQGRLDEAHESLVSALAIQRQALGERHGDIANSLNSLAILALTRQQNTRAERYLREAVAIQAEQGQGDTVQGITMVSNLGTALMRQGRYDEAEPLLVRSLERNRALVGEQHPAVFNSLHSLGQLMLRQGRTEQAVAHAQTAVALARQLWGDSRELAIAQVNLAAAQLEQGDAAAALEQATLADAMFESFGAGDRARRMQGMLVRARALAAFGEVDQARVLANEIIEASAASASERILAHALLARLARARGDQTDADWQRERALAAWSALPEPDPALRREIDRD